jgi:cytochrome o ubiquinol oxidase subunit IV
MQDHQFAQIRKEWHGSLSSYLIGFFLSILLTAASFYLVITRTFSGPLIVLILTGLALLQAIVQLWYFLHLGKESKPHWETLLFLFMVMVILIIALGSLWIMYDLNDRVMSGMTESSMSQDKHHD